MASFLIASLTRRIVAAVRAILRDRAFWVALAIGLGIGTCYFGARMLSAAEFRPLLAARVALFLVLLTSCGSMALFRGGSPERLIALVLLASFPVFFLLGLLQILKFDRFDPVAFAGDLVLLAAMIAVMLRANRYWPIAVAGLQICVVAFHLVKLYDPGMHPVAYGVFQRVWTYAMPLILAAGVWRHWLRRRKYGVDLDWSVQHERAEPPAR